MAKEKMKDEEKVVAHPAEPVKPYGKLGHNCPNGCYNAGGAQLFQSKNDPGKLECPSCGDTFEPAPAA